jgi:hypothetical protein
VHGQARQPRGPLPKRSRWYRKKSCSSYGPTISSDRCTISSAAFGRSSFGLIGVATMSRRTACTAESSAKITSAVHVIR